MTKLTFTQLFQNNMLMVGPQISSGCTNLCTIATFGIVFVVPKGMKEILMSSTPTILNYLL